VRVIRTPGTKRYLVWRDVPNSHIHGHPDYDVDIGTERFPYGRRPPASVMTRKQQPDLVSLSDRFRKINLFLGVATALAVAVVAALTLIGCAAALRQAETITHRVTGCVFGSDPEACADVPQPPVKD
jgi:hypothetical protein